jgi:CO dehydrogenase maturation factor
MTAGADSFASGLFTRFDLTLLVVEPTFKSLTVYNQYKQYSKEFGVQIRVIGNQVRSLEDEAFLRGHVGHDLLGCIPHIDELGRIERGELPYSNLATQAQAEPIASTLARIQKEADNIPKKWKEFYAQAALFHIKNARSWANAEFGQDLSKQIDQAFIREQH